MKTAFETHPDRDLIERAFVAGRSKTSWEQFKRDNITSEGNWISVSERLPERIPGVRYSQVQCLVYKRYDWQRGENSGHFYKIEILTFNHEHECWDDEDGDDHNCDIEQISHWMPLPDPPKVKEEKK